MTKKQLEELVIRIDESLIYIKKTVKDVPKMKDKLSRHSAYWIVFTVLGALLSISGTVWAILRG